MPFYNGRWGVEIYDTKQSQLFPCDNENLTPMDFVPKLSNVACVLQCGGIWIGGKGWGLTWKMIQCIVKPREVVSVYGKCRIQLSDEDLDTMEKQDVDDPPQADEEIAPSKPMSLVRQTSISSVPAKPVPVKSVASVVVSAIAPVVQQLNTHADDSDDEQAAAAAVDEVVLEEVVEAVVEEAVVASAAAAAPVKKVIKKASTVVADADADVPVVASSEPEVAKKKIVKKKM